VKAVLLQPPDCLDLLTLSPSEDPIKRLLHDAQIGTLVFHRFDNVHHPDPLQRTRGTEVDDANLVVRKDRSPWKHGNVRVLLMESSMRGSLEVWVRGSFDAQRDAGVEGVEQGQSTEQALWSSQTLSSPAQRRKKRRGLRDKSRGGCKMTKNIQQRVFASGHPPNY
jgi:hypothetical protein